MNPSAQKVHDLISKFDTAMLVTHARDDDNALHARPMGIARIDPNNDIWFFTGKSEKTHEIKADHDVLLVFQNDHRCYLSVSGRALLNHDAKMIDELWKESYKVWFPQGKTDPNLRLIRVRTTAAEYWDQTGLNGVKYLFETAKAYVTGTTPTVHEPEQHGVVSLK